MSRRAASLVALTGFFTFFTLSAGLLVAQAPRKAIKSASDLPAFSYSISYPTSGFAVNGIRSEDALRPFAEKLRRDIESLLRDYTIEDRTTLRGLHNTLLTLDLLENRTEDQVIFSGRASRIRVDRIAADDKGAGHNAMKFMMPTGQPPAKRANPRLPVYTRAGPFC